MAWTKGIPLALMVWSNLFPLSIKCELHVGNQIACFKEAIYIYENYECLDGSSNAAVQNFTTPCNSICLNTTPKNDNQSVCSNGHPCPIELLLVVDNQTHFKVRNENRECRLQITCQLSSTDCCNKHNDDSSVSQCITLQATQTPIPSFVSNEVETSSTTQKSTQEVQMDPTSTQVSGNTAPIQQSPTNETQCTSTTGIIVGSAFIGLFVGVLTTGLISFFLLKRRKQSFKRPTVSHPLYNLNGREASGRATSGETYNEIENDTHSPKISYVLPIRKDKIKSNVTTSNPEIYNHLQEDYDVKDRSNYYDHAMPLNGPQEIEPDQYGKLAIEETGAYSTVANTNKTGLEPVRNEAYSTIEASEFQLVELEGNEKDSSASYFVLTKE